MTSTLFIIQIVLAIIITILVLLQKSSSIGLGAYSGSNESVFGAKGPAGFLAKATFVAGLLFIINTLALGYFYSQENRKSAVDVVKNEIPAPKNLKPFIPAGAGANVQDKNNSTIKKKENQAKKDINTSVNVVNSDNNKGLVKNETNNTINISSQDNATAHSTDSNLTSNITDINKTHSSVNSTKENNSTTNPIKEANLSVASNLIPKSANEANISTVKETNSTKSETKKENNNSAQTPMQEENDKNSTALKSKNRAKVEVEIASVLKMHKIKFKTNSATLTPDSINTIKAIVEILRKYPNTKIEIAGYTDSDGKAEYNKKLSQQRVDAVKKALIDFGVKAENLKAVGYGSANPLVKNNSAKNKAINRRVEFRVIK